MAVLMQITVPLKTESFRWQILNVRSFLKQMHRWQGL